MKYFITLYDFSNFGLTLQYCSFHKKLLTCALSNSPNFCWNFLNLTHPFGRSRRPTCPLQPETRTKFSRQRKGLKQKFQTKKNSIYSLSVRDITWYRSFIGRSQSFVGLFIQDDIARGIFRFLYLLRICCSRNEVVFSLVKLSAILDSHDERRGQWITWIMEPR